MLETGRHRLTARVLDLAAPIGKGQRELVVAPPRTGENRCPASGRARRRHQPPGRAPDGLLADERPEEVTGISRSVRGEVIASTFDRAPAEHTAGRLPGQPVATAEMLGEALAGRSPVDSSWGEELRQVLNELREHRVVEAFSFATALGLGLEALPERHRPVTAAALVEAGFVGTDLCRSMRRPLPADDLPRIPQVRIEARGRGVGRALLGSALQLPTEPGASEVILFVDDEPGGERDRTAANRLYDASGFIDYLIRRHDPGPALSAGQSGGPSAL
ncbi:GNAT family N-acetyltransferase [Amycolatopsis methanolica]|uniref:GNAT family N-acetyltransferase n=1 Tax=Amycolatopsis methanolica TaxID=1814 RepID=UPI00068448C0|nr:hypothetical protein [Amycolatopsis methanolica]